MPLPAPKNKEKKPTLYPVVLETIKPERIFRTKNKELQLVTRYGKKLKNNIIKFIY